MVEVNVGMIIAVTMWKAGRDKKMWLSKKNEKDNIWHDIGKNCFAEKTMRYGVGDGFFNGKKIRRK